MEPRAGQETPLRKHLRVKGARAGQETPQGDPADEAPDLDRWLFEALS